METKKNRTIHPRARGPGFSCSGVNKFVKDFMVDDDETEDDIYKFYDYKE